MRLLNEMWKKIEQKIKHTGLDFGALVSELLISSYIADFMIQTGLLGQSQAVETLPEEGGLPTSIASRGNPDPRGAVRFWHGKPIKP